MSDPKRDDVIEEIMAEKHQALEKKKSDPPIKPKSSKSVAIYLVILFAAAFLLLLMAYFMQQRSNNEVIGNLQDSMERFQTMDELLEENQQLRAEVEKYEALIEELLSIGFLTRSEDGTLHPAQVIDLDELQAMGIVDIVTSSGVDLDDLLLDSTPSP